MKTPTKLFLVLISVFALIGCSTTEERAAKQRAWNDFVQSCKNSGRVVYGYLDRQEGRCLTREDANAAERADRAEEEARRNRINQLQVACIQSGGDWNTMRDRCDKNRPYTIQKQEPLEIRIVK